ncbi:hypothetical protein E2562_030226 [Oryza meyeriana var. granulata]|uniref:KIB1-4 beta-propeller domain-containing protein n=1 Tax=Oryza meyeriana var. granulata TaxID=110450 RepID=A0A6G1D974_9ORYZ|nr:hypothetical protein E2562_030226 [Oryza meyeriana var. granulata]
MLQRVYKVEEASMRNPYITEVALSCSPAGSDDCVALCVYRWGESLAVARPGDASWTCVEVGHEYHLGPRGMRKVRVAAGAEKSADRPRRESIGCARWWLAVDTASASAGGALVLVATERCWTREIYLCAFRWDDELRFLRRPKGFAGRALFTGRGTALFAEARHLPWCAGDCIYFTLLARRQTAGVQTALPPTR